MRMSEEQSKVLDAVARERRMQDDQWGGPEHDDRHSDAQWVKFICHHANESTKNGQFLPRMIKVAALAVAATEAHIRDRSRQFVSDTLLEAIKRK